MRLVGVVWLVREVDALEMLEGGAAPEVVNTVAVTVTVDTAGQADVPDIEANCVVDAMLVPLIRERVVVVVSVVVEVMEVVLLAVEVRAAKTPSKNPGFRTIWLMSHIITPPKLENVLQ